MEINSSDLSESALVIIDLQTGVVKLPAEPNNAETVIANAAALAKAFRNNGYPVILVHVALSAGGQDGLKPVTDAKPVTGAPASPAWSDFVPELTPQPEDIVITKRQWNAFYGTELDLQLRRRGVETIVMCGIATDLGVEGTARAAYDLGFQQLFAEDAMAAHSAAEHQHTVTAILPRLGRVRSTQEILKALE